MLTAYASAGTVDITPRTPVPLAGSGLRRGAFQAVADPLEANALVLRSNGPPVVLVSADLLFIGEELRAGVLRRLGGSVPDEALFFAASHTHFAPATDDLRPRLGRMDAGYVEQVCEQVAELVTNIMVSPPVPVTIEYAQGQADHSMNRRLRAPWHLSRRGLLLGAVVGAPNPLGPRDETIHLLRISQASGSLVGLIWSYACHPVSFPRPLDVTAEYPGWVRHHLRRELGSQLPVLFWQGFAGDVRPPELDRSTSLASRARRLVMGPRFGRFAEGDWRAWADSLASRVAAVAVAPVRHVASGSIGAARVSRPLGDFVIRGDGGRRVTFQGVALGDGLIVVGISAEVVTEYGHLVRAAFPGAVIIPVGYIDDVYGYLPTARMLREGGYEASWFLQPFGLEGPLHSQLEEHCVAALQDLAAVLSAAPTSR